MHIGPFKTKYQANLYKKEFEKRERMSTHVVDPRRVKRQQERRAAKLAVRKKKYGQP